MLKCKRRNDYNCLGKKINLLGPTNQEWCRDIQIKTTKQNIKNYADLWMLSMRRLSMLLLL